VIHRDTFQLTHDGYFTVSQWDILEATANRTRYYGIPCCIKVRYRCTRSQNQLPIGKVLIVPINVDFAISKSEILIFCRISQNCFDDAYIAINHNSRRLNSRIAEVTNAHTLLSTVIAHVICPIAVGLVRITGRRWKKKRKKIRAVVENFICKSNIVLRPFVLNPIVAAFPGMRFGKVSGMYPLNSGQSDGNARTVGVVGSASSREERRRAPACVEFLSLSLYLSGAADSESSTRSMHRVASRDGP